jgi:hypothetical protein
MSEWNRQQNNRVLRWHLLATVSAFALLGCAFGGAAASEDADQPVIWIELGGQLNRLDDGQDKIAPPFFTSISNAGFVSPLTFEKQPSYSIDEDGKISFQPNGSDWVLSASIRYRRSSGKSYHHQQTDEIFPGLRTINPTGARFRYAETTTSNAETHAILDFMAGKDVGLGTGGTSVLGGGLRFAQFQSKSGLAVYADPDYARTQGTGLPHKYFHNYSARAQNRTSFTGVGPTLSWDASMPLSGRAQNGQISFDWGLNGAVLFGRQKSVGSHQTKGVLNTGVNIAFLGIYYHTTHYTHGGPRNRSRMVAVPNLGAMAGVSFRYANAKVSLGYRADMFLGAMDGGIDARKSENVGFYGPFANVNIGFGG